MIDIEKMMERCYHESDPSLVAYMIRDEPEIEFAGLKDLAWQLSIDPYTSKNDVLGLLKDLEKYRYEEWRK